MDSYIQTLRASIGSQLIMAPGVRAIIINDLGHVLLQRRLDMPVWCLPSGSVEPDETALDALKREVYEETRLHVRHAQPMGVYSGPGQRFTYPNGDQVQGFALAFIVRRWDGTPAADGEEGAEVRFWPMDALPQDLAAIHVETLNDFVQYRDTFILK